MSCESTAPKSAENVPVTVNTGGRCVDSAALLDDQREVLIRHRGDTYRLRLTGAGKLILIK